MNDSHVLEEAKKPRVMGDIPLELIHEVMSTITDPAAMLGPEVSRANLGGQLVGPPPSFCSLGHSHCWEGGWDSRERVWHATLVCIASWWLGWGRYTKLA